MNRSVDHHTLGSAGMLATDVVLEWRRFVDWIRLIKNVAPIDPLTIAEAGILRDNQGFGSAVANLLQRHNRVDQHRAFRRAIGACDSFAVNPSVVAGAAAVDQRRTADRART